jgi:hypothetical protein
LVALGGPASLEQNAPTHQQNTPPERSAVTCSQGAAAAANQLSIGNRPFFYMWLELVPLSQVTFLCIFVLWPGQLHRQHGLIS